jgi:hypothetical protein
VSAGDLRADASGVAVGAVDLGPVSQINRMLKHGYGRSGQVGLAFGFRHQGVALVAVFADDASIGADVLAIVAAEAAAEVIVAQVVGMGLPVQLHLWERGALEDLLHFGHGVANFELLGLGDVWVFAFVEAPAIRWRCLGSRPRWWGRFR